MTSWIPALRHITCSLTTGHCPLTTSPYTPHTPAQKKSASSKLEPAQKSKKSKIQNYPPVPQLHTPWPLPTRETALQSASSNVNSEELNVASCEAVSVIDEP
jgi:hypothetical protein